MNQPPDITPRNSIGSFRLNKLQQLEKANAELTERNQRYELLCIQLQNDVKFLKDQIKNNPSESFETDEEELQKEIGRFDEQMHTPPLQQVIHNRTNGKE